MCVTELGIVILVKPLQKANVAVLILVIALDILTLVNPVQCPKASLPI